MLECCRLLIYKKTPRDGGALEDSWLATREGVIREEWIVGDITLDLDEGWEFNRIRFLSQLDLQENESFVRRDELIKLEVLIAPHEAGASLVYGQAIGIGSVE